MNESDVLVLNTSIEQILFSFEGRDEHTRAGASGELVLSDFGDVWSSVSDRISPGAEEP